MKLTRKIISLVLCLSVITSALISLGSVTVFAAKENFSKNVTLENVIASSVKRGSHITENCSVEDGVLKVPVPQEKHVTLSVENDKSIYAYLTMVNGTSVLKGANGYTRAIWIKYRVKSVGNGGYAQIGLGYTKTASNNWSKTNIVSIGEKHYEVGNKEYSFAASIPYVSSQQDYRIVFAGDKGCEIEIISIKWATKNSKNYGVVRYHIGNDYMYPVFCNNQSQMMTGFESSSPIGSSGTIDKWYDTNDNVVSGNLMTSTTGYADIDLYDQPTEAAGNRTISSSGVNWYSDTVTDSFTSGNGTASSPYIIKTAAELRFAIASGGNGKYYKLGNDIEINEASANGWYNNRGLKQWKKAEDNAEIAFAGNFDGAGFTISGLLIDYTANSGENALGLFPVVNGAVIKNLKLENICVKAETADKENNHAFGSLIGKAAIGGATVENVLIKSAVLNVRGTEAPTTEKTVGIGGIIGLSNANVSVKDVVVKDISVINNFADVNYKSYIGATVGFISADKSLNLSNALCFNLAPVDVNLPKAKGTVSNIWAIGDNISLNANYSGLKASAESAFHGKHSDFVKALNGSANWLPDKLCFMPTLKSFASEQTEQHGEHLEPTCKLGERCEYCGKVFDTMLDPDNHINVITKNGTPYTCDMIGYAGDLYCKDCDKLLGEGQSVDALGHDYGDWKTVKAATTKATGLKERTCKRAGCGYKDSEEIPVLTETKTEDKTDNKQPNKNNNSNKPSQIVKDYEPEIMDTTSSSPIQNGEMGTITIFNGADNTVRVILLIAIPSAILLAGIVLSILILLKKKK